MTAELDIVLSPGQVRGLPVPVTVADTDLLQGPCWLAGWSLRDATGDIPANVEGTVLSPGALATIATTASLPAGTYAIAWSVFLQGAPGAGDANNFQLRDSAGVVVGSVNPGVAGAYPQNPVEVTTTVAGAVFVQSIAAGTVGVTYGAEISVQPTLAPNTVVEIQDGNQVLGESCIPANGSDTEIMPGDGLHVSQRIHLHIVSGAVTGVVYARLARQTG